MSFARRAQRQFVVASLALGVVFIFLVVSAIWLLTDSIGRIFLDAAPGMGQKIQFDLAGAREIRGLEHFWTPPVVD